jgi:hypothetical protein
VRTDAEQQRRDLDGSKAEIVLLARRVFGYVSYKVTIPGSFSEGYTAKLYINHIAPENLMDEDWGPSRRYAAENLRERLVKRSELERKER